MFNDEQLKTTQIQYIVSESFAKKITYLKHRNKNEHQKLCYILSHYATNTSKEDGRINVSNDTALTISPYADHFWSNIEPSVKPIVKILVDRGYMTCGSCDGHSWTAKRSIQIAFTSMFDRLEFDEFIIKKFPILVYSGFIQLKHSEFLGNVDLDIMSSEDIPIKKSSTVTDKHKEAENFNEVFHRSAYSYCFTDFVIGPELPMPPAKLNIAQKIYKFLKINYWEFITRHITKKLQFLDYA